MSQAKVQAGLKFENLLVITDLSVESGAAAPYARALASRNGSKVRVLHVIDPLPYAFGDPEIASRKRREIWDAANTELSHWTAQFLSGTQATSTLVDSGSAFSSHRFFHCRHRAHRPLSESTLTETICLSAL